MTDLWTKSTDRGLHPIEKIDRPEDARVFTGEDAPTFNPALISDAGVREKVHSSGYGVITAALKKVVLEENELRPWQEKPSFKPQIEETEVSRELKKKARSSGYGRKTVVTPKKRKAAKPRFKPQMTDSKEAKLKRKAAHSSGYGKVLAQSPRPKSAPPSKFRPDLPQCPIRARAASSRYGIISVTPSRPATAPGREFEHPQPRRVTMYTLLADKADKDDPPPPEPISDKPAFVLDCVSLANQQKAAKSTHCFTDHLAGPELPKTQYSEELKARAPSSKYGVVGPDPTPRPQTAPAAPRFNFSPLKPAAVSELSLPPASPLNDKVHSSGYGVVAPESTAKPEPPVPEPEWKLTLKTVLPEELPPFQKSPLNKSVQSHGYGTDKFDLPRSDKPEVESEPVWAPVTPSKGFPELDRPPRSPLVDSVQGHYGRDYSPTKGQKWTRSVNMNGSRYEEYEEYEIEDGNGVVRSFQTQVVRTHGGDEEEEEYEEVEEEYEEEETM